MVAKYITYCGACEVAEGRAECGREDEHARGVKRGVRWGS